MAATTGIQNHVWAICVLLLFNSPLPALPGLSKFRLGLVQMLVGADKAANLVRAAKLVKEAASNGAQVVALPVSVLSSLL